MWIKSIRIQNYKCFLNSGEIEFTQGFNVIVGKNNSGKTALVEALSLNASSYHHKSDNNKTNMTDPNKSFFEFEITAKKTIWVNLNQHREVLISADISEGDEVERRLNEAILGVRFVKFAGENALQHMQLPKIRNEEGSILKFKETKNGDFQYQNHSYQSPSNLLENLISREFLSERNVYAFKAERLKVGQSGIGTNLILNPDASNLPEVLHNLLSENFSMYERFVSHVSQIFPELKWITAPLINKNEVKIHLWFVERVTERSDLAIPLQDSGTGVGQVLAILYLVVTSDKPRTIIIDEPQSFLHPGAIRRLFSLLRQHYSQHQYIVTTHSPTVVAATNPENIILLEKYGFESKGRNIGIGKPDDMFNILNSVGASLSDVFGADNILWVEGSTEEKAFPILVSRKVGKPLLGTVIMGVRNTGDVVGGNKKTRENTKGIYDKLSKSAALIPPSIGFVFDREGLKKQEMQDLERMGNLHFLDRIMYENYLLIPEAIVQLISELENFSANVINLEIVTEWLEKNKWNYGKKIPETQRTHERWLRDVHGADLLHALFSDLSEEKTYNYNDDKAYYGEKLTQIILDLEEAGEIESDFDEIVELLEKLIKDPDEL